MNSVIALAVWSFATIAMAAPAPAHGPAAEPAHAGGHGHEAGIEWVTPLFGSDGKIGLLWMLINFGVLLWILEKLMFSKLRAKTAVKHDTIKGELERAKTARVEAETVLADVRGKLDGLDATVAEILAEAKTRAESDRKRLIDAAEREAARIQATAKATATREAESYRRQLEGEIVQRAITRAAELLRSRIDVMDQKRMVDDFVGQIANAELGRGDLVQGDLGRVDAPKPTAPATSGGPQ